MSDDETSVGTVRKAVSEVSGASRVQMLSASPGSWIAGRSSRHPSVSSLSARSQPVHDDPPLYEREIIIPVTPKKKDEQNEDDGRVKHEMPWSPSHTGPPRSFMEDLTSTPGKPFTPTITKKAHNSDNSGIAHLLDCSSKYTRARKDNSVNDSTNSFTPRINTYRTNSETRGPVFERLYECKGKTKEVDRTSEPDGYTGKPMINNNSKRSGDRSAELRLKWNEERERRIDDLREREKMKELEGVTGAPKLNDKSLEMCRKRDEKVEDRLIKFGNRVKQTRSQVMSEEEQRTRDDANPHISAHAAATVSDAPAHERLYAMRRDKEAKVEVAVAVSEAASEESCTFQPSISKKSHQLAGGDLPKYEKIEDRLLRQGTEHKQRCTEHANLLRKIQDETRSGAQNVGPYSRLLVDLAEKKGKRRSFRDPIGVDNCETAETLKQKHPSGHAFRPYVGQNSRDIDQQVHGDRRLNWDERLGNLYYKEQEKENKLQRMRGTKEEEEMLRCKVSQAAKERKTDSALHARNKAWKQRLENKRRWGKHQKEEDEIKECTFRPTINSRSSSRARSPSSRGRSPTSQPRVSMPPERRSYAAIEMEKEAQRHEAISQHIQAQLSSSPPRPSQAPFPSPRGIGSEYVATSLSPGLPAPLSDEEFDEEFYDGDGHDSDRLALLSQLEMHRSILEEEEARRY